MKIKQTDMDENTLNECLFQIPFYIEGLRVRNYSFPDVHTFRERIKKTIRIDMSTVHQCANMLDYPQFLLFTFSDYEDILFSKQENIILPLSTLEVTDSIIERTLHWNNFIFHNNNNSLTWLIENDLPFLTQLIISFGYDINYKLNKAVLQQLSKNYFSSKNTSEFPYPNLFAIKNSGKLEIRKGLIQYIAGNSTCDNTQLLQLLYDYGCHILHTAIEFSLEEKLQVAAYIAHYIELCYSKNKETGLIPTTPPGSFLKKELLSYPAAKEWLEKNNFYK
ncbi:hypothetical protein [Bacteroides sp. 224]|uniref:hypothetical protein n=1 Tax=Bacteroides sp. 224 TaxID=2302936 RepID=UPI0013D5D279|nr:hypothetical protein [Bacteroides sp. 224]NDV65226.1 hypothetical protein [Bacteroides sp. 224]